MTVCRGCQSNAFAVAGAISNLRRTLGKLHFNPNSPKLNAYAERMKVKFDAAKAEQREHQETHEAAS